MTADAAVRRGLAVPNFAEATWWIESVKTTEPGWQDAVRERLGGSAGRGQRS